MPVLPARAESTIPQSTTPDTQLPGELSDQYYPQVTDNPGISPPLRRTLDRYNANPMDNRSVDAYWADLDGDHDVDAADLSIIAEVWDCASGDGCYLPEYDYEASSVIDAQDLAWIGNEYDVAPPQISIVSPAEDQVNGTSNVAVTGVVTDSHAVISVTVNGLTAGLVGTDFSVPTSRWQAATKPLSS